MPQQASAARRHFFQSRLFARPADERRELDRHRELLTETAHLLLEDTAPDPLCQTIFERLRDPIGVTMYLFYLPDGEGKLCLASAGGGELRNRIGHPLPEGPSVAGKAAAEHREIYIANLGRRHDAITGGARSVGLRCYVCFPLLAGDRLLGTLSFGSTTRDSFVSDDLELMRLISQQIALATHRRVRIEQLRELEKLAAAGRQNATLAHEINNPLESLGNLLYMLRSEVHSPEAVEMVERAEVQVARLSEVARRTLESFRGKNQTPTRFDFSELLEQLAGDIQLPHHTRLDHTIEPGLCVEAIPGEMRQVFFNLLLNAGNYTPPGQPVTLTLRRDGDHAEARVRDEGQGISEDSARHLFQPFYTTRRSSGTGVGLWLSKELVENAGGELTWSSDPRQRPGTDFIVRLPLVNGDKVA